MYLIDELLKIEKLKMAERKELSRLVLKNNPTFAKYLDLCYNDEYQVCSVFGRLNLKYKPSEAPLGMNYGTLESVFAKFKRLVYNDGSEIEDKQAKARLVQIFEIVSEGEVSFLKQVIKGKYSGLSKAEYDKVT